MSASSPQELRLFYESSATLLPSIPKETSANLRHLLLGLLQRNHKERMSFDEFFNHPFLETSLSTKKCSPSSVPSYPSSGSGSSSSSSSTSQLASPQHSDGEMNRLQPEELYSLAQATNGTLGKEKISPDNRNSPTYVEDYVMVSAQFSSEYPCEAEDESPTEHYLINSGNAQLTRRGSGPAGRTPPPSLPISPSKLVGHPTVINGRKCSPSMPIPVPTQIQNYQRMKQNLQPAVSRDSIRVICCAGSSSATPVQRGGCSAPGPGVESDFPMLEKEGGQPQHSSPQAGLTPKRSEQTLPRSTRTGLLPGSPDALVSSSHKQHVPTRKPNRTTSVQNLQSLEQCSASQTISAKSANKKGPFKRSLSAGKLSDMLLKAAFGANVLEEESDESFSCDRSMDTTAPPTGHQKVFQFSDSPPSAVFAMGSPLNGNTPPDDIVPKMLSGSPSYITSAWLLNSHPVQRGSRRNSETEVMDAISHYSFVFHPPALPEDTLMEQAHMDALSDLRFTLAFVSCVLELASTKEPGMGTISSPDVSFLEQSSVTDQISLLTREWSYAEQLVLYMKAEEFLSSALHTAQENIKQGQLLPSATVKQVQLEILRHPGSWSSLLLPLPVLSSNHL
ncbi:serine/threonine-protein kinase ULK1-like [Nematolebias whitei]|uniref:serine/threonine-protein kinase ULK1-like n=1 Tax=Nematolebias whitei TaxID=451745 RepID=UPI00189C0FEE|nr:serine/threonine-protein kinase ULK1-like [Nematolebias whitei]